VSTFLLSFPLSLSRSLHPPQEAFNLLHPPSGGIQSLFLPVWFGLRWMYGYLEKVDVRLPEKVYSNSDGARPMHLIITMIKCIRISTVSIKNSLSLGRREDHREERFPFRSSSCRATRQSVIYVEHTSFMWT